MGFDPWVCKMCECKREGEREGEKESLQPHLLNTLVPTFRWGLNLIFKGTEILKISNSFSVIAESGKAYHQKLLSEFTKMRQRGLICESKTHKKRKLLVLSCRKVGMPESNKPLTKLHVEI